MRTSGILARVLVTDRRLYGPRAEVASNVATAARRGRATAVLLREKDLDEAGVLALARELCAATPLPVIVAKSPTVAAAAGLAGVHLGWDAPSVARAREVLGPGPLIGVSVHGHEEALRRAAEGCDYLLLGPIRSTPSKEGRVAALGLDVLAAVARSAGVPVVAIGGLRLEDEGAVRGAGAAGLAAIRAFAAGGGGAGER